MTIVTNSYSEFFFGGGPFNRGISIGIGDTVSLLNNAQ